MKRCALVKAGILAYDEGILLQEDARNLVLKGTWDGVILLLEHFPVITIGRNGGTNNIREDMQVLKTKGIQFAEANRGGNVTCHNPGQLVGYPVLDLSKWKKDVHWYVDNLEEVIIRTLAAFGIKGGRKAKYTGVWLGSEKIAAIGIAVNKWITYHGFALNVANDLSLFNNIIPCGITEFGVTSFQKAGAIAERDEVVATLIEKFSDVFECTLEETALENTADVVKGLNLNK